MVSARKTSSLKELESELSEWISGKSASDLAVLQRLACVQQELPSGPSKSDWDAAVIAALKKGIQHLDHEYRNWAFHCVSVWEQPEFRQLKKNPRHEEIGRRLYRGGVGSFGSQKAARDHLRKKELKTSEESILRMVCDAIFAHEEEAKLHLEVRNALAPRLQPETLDRVWRFGCLPILESEMHRQILKNFHYTITLKPRQVGNSQSDAYMVTTRLKADRRIEATPVRVVFARTKRALDTSYLDDRCLLRELVRWPEEDWAELTDLMEARLVVDGMTVEGTKVPITEEESLEKLIYQFKIDLPRKALPVVVEARFPMRKESVFPVLMSNYFCTGVTEIDFDLDVEKEAGVEVFPTFVPDEPPSPDALRPNHYTIKCRDLIWPGAGVIFVWEKV